MSTLPVAAPAAAQASNQDARRRVLHRLRRAQGQLAAVIEAVEDGKSCQDIVVQLAAASKALDRAGVVLISSAMQDCLTGPKSGGQDGLTADEFEKLFLMLA